MATDDILALPGFRVRFAPSKADRRRLLIRDSISWMLVAIIHIAFFLVLVVSLQQNRDRLGRRSAIETILDLSLLNQSTKPRVNLSRPDEVTPDISAMPLTIQPPKLIVPVIPPSPDAPATPGDVLKSVGQALACGANNFEYLNKAQQARCTHTPWQGLQLPNGAIVLLAPRAAPPQARVNLSGADEVAHEAQTSSGCPIMLNTPCLQDMFTGNNSRNPGTPVH